MVVHSENAMAARAVVELVVRSTSNGRAHVDEIAAIDLAKLGHQVWRSKLLADRTRHRRSCGHAATPTPRSVQ
jgi:hypothetical protein